MSYNEEREQSEVLTVEEAARLMNYTPQRVRQLLREGKLKGNKVEGGRKWLIPRREIDLFCQTPQGLTVNQVAADKTEGGEGLVSSSEAQAHEQLLRELARQLFEQFRLNLLQVVQTEQVGVAPARLYAAAPWRVEGLLESIPDPDTNIGGNSGLEIDRKVSPPEVFLVVEKNHAFPRLIDHLTWAIPQVQLAREMWRKNLSYAVSSAMTLWEELRRRPDLANERWVELEDWTTASHGLLSDFTQSAVAAVCGARWPEIDGGRFRDGHLTILEDARGSAGDRVYQLSWETQEPVNRRIGLAISHDRDWLEHLKDLHQSLRQELEGHQEVVHLGRALWEALKYERDLRSNLNVVLQAEKFPGTCQDCPPVYSFGG
jgi:excisionase family DNA binding protein